LGQGVVDGGAATYPVVGLTLRDRVVAAIQAGGATEEMVDAAVGVFGELGFPTEPQRPATQVCRPGADGM
jgi:hypothetical protein